MTFPRSRLLFPRRSSRLSSAFTLAELLVVIFIIVLIMTVSLTYINSMKHSTRKSQAINVVSAFLASARAVALNTHRKAAVIFYEETTTGVSKPNAKQTAVAVASEDASITNQFAPVANRATEYVPTPLVVGTLASNSANFTFQNGTTTRAIVFDGNGQLLILSGMTVPASAGVDTPSGIAQDWNLTTGPSSPGIIIYDGSEYNAAANKSLWLSTPSNITYLLVNSYTGNVIR